MTKRVHILGASGSGTTTLGRALAQELGAEHFDADDFFWTPTDPPYQLARPAAERIALLLSRLPSADGWVFSGSAMGWAKPLEALYDLIVYLRVAAPLRLDRLKRREQERYGARIAAGGDLADTHVAFMTWATVYDTAGAEQRSRVAHEAWLSTQPAPVLRLDSAIAVDELVTQTLVALR